MFVCMYVYVCIYVSMYVCMYVCMHAIFKCLNERTDGRTDEVMDLKHEALQRQFQALAERQQHQALLQHNTHSSFNNNDNSSNNDNNNNNNNDHIDLENHSTSVHPPSPLSSAPLLPSLTLRINKPATASAGHTSLHAVVDANMSYTTATAAPCKTAAAAAAVTAAQNKHNEGDTTTAKANTITAAASTTTVTTTTSTATAAATTTTAKANTKAGANTIHEPSSREKSLLEEIKSAKKENVELQQQLASALRGRRIAEDQLHACDTRRRRECTELRRQLKQAHNIYVYIYIYIYIYI